MLTDHDIDHQRTAAHLSAQVGDFAALSRRYAARGDARRAALAAWAADIRTVQSLLWEGGVSAAKDPAHEIRAVATAVETALVGRGTASATSVRAVLEGARTALAAAFDESVHELLAGRFEGLEHLDDVPAPQPGAANAAVMQRLDGRSGEELAGELLTAAGDCRAVATVMEQVGDDEEAGRQHVSADLAGFEAYLVMASAASGDATLATTELRWDLAAWKAERSATVDGPDLAVATREAVRSVVLPAEDEALLVVLDQVSAGRAAG